MRRFTYVFMPVAAALMVSLAACSDYDNGYTQKELQYAKDFKAVFGEIDSEQDWNVAERTSVTVTTQQNSQVKIYALVDGTYSLVGDYSNVSGTRELGIDVRKGVTDLIVSDGNEAVKTTVGGSANLGGTRTVHEIEGAVTIKKITDPAGVTIGETLYPMYKEVSKADYEAVTDKETGAVPEIGERKTYTNLNRVTHDFSYVSTGKFVVYPYYWQTSNTNTIGIYYYEGGQRIEVPLYTIKGGDELQYLTRPGQEPYWQDIFDFTDPRNARDYNWAAAGYTSENFKPAVWTVNQYDNTKYDLTKVAQILITPNGSWQSYTGGDCNEIFSSYSAQMVRGQGIVVDILEGTVFGMYLLDASGFKCYSQSELNTSNQCGPGVTDDGNGNVKDDDGIRPCYASTFHVGDQMFLGFEDWANQWKNSDMDFNDVVLAFSGATPTVINEDKEAGTWLLACEDLGGSFDTDYNDVVLKVEHVSGQTTATVTPLAAGGTLASYIFYTDPVVNSYGEQCLGEIHELLGATPTASGSYAPINAGSSRGTAGTPKTINVDENWSMAYYSAADWNTTGQYKNYNMGGFEIRVLNSGTDPLTGAISSTNSAFGDGSRIAAPDKGEAPMMLCLPYTYRKTGTDGKTREYVWAWSQELYSLSAGQGYGDGTYPMFAEWVKDHTKNTDWYMYPSGGTVSELILAESDESSEGGGEGGEGGETLTSNIPWANGQSFTYKDKNNNLTGYSNAAFIDFSGVTDPDGYTATLAVTFASMPGCTIYWDYKTGEQIIDDYGSGYKTSGTLSLTAEQFHKAKKTGGIYIVGYGNTPIVLTSANLTTTYGAPVTFDDDDDNTGEDGSNYGTQVLTSIISGTSTVPASAFASANTKVYLTFLYKAGGRSYTQFYTHGQYSQLQKETQDITPDTDTYVTITISDTDWINGLKTYGITGFQDWNNGVLAANFGGLWIRCE